MWQTIWGDRSLLFGVADVAIQDWGAKKDDGELSEGRLVLHEQKSPLRLTRQECDDLEWWSVDVKAKKEGKQVKAGEDKP